MWMCVFMYHTLLEQPAPVYLKGRINKFIAIVNYYCVIISQILCSVFAQS